MKNVFQKQFDLQVEKVKNRAQNEAKKDVTILSSSSKKLKSPQSKSKHNLEIVKRQRLSADTKSLQNKRQKRKSRKLILSIISLRPALSKYELVWARLKGFPNWPGVIECETSSGKYLIHFFGDYTHSEVTKAKISHLMEGFETFSKVMKPTALLQKSIRELSFYFNDQNRSSCPICDMQKEKEK